MRLSDILKSEMTTSAPIAPKKPAPPAPPVKHIPAQKHVPPPPATPAQDVNAAIDRAVIETRKRLEQDFQRQMDKIQEESRRFTEEKLRDEEQRSFLRTEAFKKEKQQLMAQIEQMRAENDALKLTGKTLEAAQKEISEGRAKLAEEFQKKIAEIELDRQRKEQQAPKAAVPPPAPAQPVSVPPSPPSKPVDAYVSVKQVEKEMPAKAAANPLNAAKARELYQELMTHTQTFFDRAKRNEIKVEPLMQVLDSFIQEADTHDDLIALISEPYVPEQSFISHAVNSAIFAVILGNDLKLSFDELRTLGIAALLHDIGLAEIHESLDYPRQLPQSVKDEVLKHPEKGAEMLTPYLNEIAVTAIAQHQELMNGKGYPKGLQGEDIHFFARIISIVDSFEAMIHERPYRRKAMEISQAVKEMIEIERGLYDRDIMKALLARVGLYPVKSLVELSNRQIARVIRQNRQFPLSPIVQLEFDENGLKLSNPQILDLSKNQLIHITGPVKPQVSQIRERSEKPIAKSKKVNVVMEIIPLLLMGGILVLLVYLIVKI